MHLSCRKDVILGRLPMKKLRKKGHRFPKERQSNLKERCVMSRQFIQLINTPDSDADLYLLDLSIYLLKTKNRTGRLQVPCVIPGTQSTTAEKKPRFAPVLTWLTVSPHYSGFHSLASKENGLCLKGIKKAAPTAITF